MRILSILILSLLYVLFAQVSITADGSGSDSSALSAFDPGYSDIRISYKNKPIPYRIFSIFTMPGSRVELTISGRDANDLWVSAEAGAIARRGREVWEWRAPQKSGIYEVVVSDLANGNQTRLNMFVLTPASEIKGEYLNGYRIGKYPAKPLNGNPEYNAPTGFIEVNRTNRGTFVSPHFRLSQFLCKQEGGYPKYVVLRERLLLQLEYTLEEANKLGYRADTFTIMSGYRTPYYNARIGNGRYSRHIYGDAADIFIDLSGNGMMDDLNGDGVIDRKDAMILFRIVEDIQKNEPAHFRQGGIGLYEKRPWRGPFVHVDTRGHQARWYQ